MLLLLALAIMAVAPPQTADDPAIRAAVERFYAMQEAEDIDGYLALWSATARRPQAAQLKFIFDSGDDKFSDIVITRVTPVRDQVVVRLTVARQRTSTAARRPDGTMPVFNSRMTVSLTFVREGTAWKLLREGSATDGLAATLVEAGTPEERNALLEADPDLVGPMLLSALSRQGDALSQVQQYGRAQQVYELLREIAVRIGSRKGEADALQNIGNSMYFQRNLAGALAAYESRLAIERDAANDEGIASALLGVATIKYSFFEYTEALDRYRESLAIQERLKDEAGVATTLISTGNIQFVQGDYEGAAVDYRRSRDIYRKLTDTNGEARALEGIGRASASLGDYGAALVAYAGVIEEGRARNDHHLQGNGIQSSGEIHFRLGNLDKARSLFEESRGHFEALKDQAAVGRVWQGTALTDLVAARFALAEQEYGKSGAACGPAGDGECVARSIVGLAFAQSSQDHFDEAIASYHKAIAAFTALRKNEDAARAEVGLSQALLGKKDFAAALAAGGRARQQATAIGIDDVVWRGLVAEARAQRQLGAPAKATAAAADAVAAVQRLAAAALERPDYRVSSDTVAAYALLAVLQAEAGDAAAAFATAEQRRAHALRIDLARNERDIARGMTPAERDAERASAAELVSLHAQLSHEKALPKPDAARVSRFDEKIAAATSTRREQQAQLFQRLPELRAWRGLAPAAMPADVAPLLDADGTIVAEFVIDDDSVLAIVGERTGETVAFHASMAAVSRQTLAERVARALDPAALGTVETWRKASADVVASIPADALARITAARRVILVPDGILWRVPFEALPDKSTEVAEATDVVYAGSITSLLRAPAIQAQAPALPLLAVAAPEIAAGLRDRITSTSPGWVLRPAEAGDAEARAIAARFTEPAAALLGGAAATERAFRAQAPAAALLHLAAPFRINSASALFSPALLSPDGPPAPETDATDDGVLEAREVMSLDLHARAVVISDGAAMSMRDAAEQVPTVRWAWRIAGVPSMVMPRWPTDAAAASDFLGEFYQRIIDGDAPEAALQGARALLRAREETRAPYYWAGWMLIGPG